LEAEPTSSRRHEWKLNESRERRQAIYRARQRANPLTLSELRDITDMWVETTMKLTEADLRRMSHLQSAQVRRLRREAVITAYNARGAGSRLPEPLLLDAAHIVSDKDERLGQPVIPNGIPPSKIHHTAFDAHRRSAAILGPKWFTQRRTVS
jgi:hypothetical protein